MRRRDSGKVRIEVRRMRRFAMREGKKKGGRGGHVKQLSEIGANNDDPLDKICKRRANTTYNQVLPSTWERERERGNDDCEATTSTPTPATAKMRRK